MKKKTKQQRSLQASNAAHKALMIRAIKRGEEQKRLYHGTCILRQEKAGYVFNSAEREKVFDDIISAFY